MPNPTTAMPTAAQAMGRPPSWVVYWGITTVSIIVFLLFVLAAVVHYPDTLQAPATTYTNQQPLPIQSPQSGSLSALWVENGDTVAANQPLAVLYSRADWQTLWSLDSLLRTGAEDQALSFDPTGLGEVGGAYREWVLASQQLAYQHQSNILPKQLQHQAQEQAHFRSLKTSALKQEQLYEQELSNARIEWQRAQDLLASGVISKKEYETAESVYLQQQRALEQLREQILRYDWQTQTQTQTALTLKKDRSDRLASQRQQVQQRLATLQQALHQWKTRHLLLAPHTGVLLFPQRLAVGMALPPEMVVFHLLPLTDQPEHYLRATLPAQGIGKLAIGQRALVQLAPYPKEEYGTLSAKVEHIAPIALNDTYEVLLRLPDAWVTSYGQELPAQSNLSAVVEIETQEYTVLERLLDGLWAALE